MPFRSSLLLVGGVGGLLVGSLLGTGCTLDSSGSFTPPDTTTVSTPTTSSPSAKSSAESVASPSSASSDDPRTVAERLDDVSTEARVKQALVRARSLRSFDFVPTVAQGRLTLRGDVDTRAQYRTAERVASNVEDVTEITNQVTVQGRIVAEGSDTADATHHTVRRGDTLTGIAKAYGVPVQQLRALNDLSGPLQPGQRIRVR